MTVISVLHQLIRLWEINRATELFALCVKLTSAEKLLKEMEQNPQPVKKKEADQQLPE